VTTAVVEPAGKLDFGHPQDEGYGSVASPVSQESGIGHSEEATFCGEADKREDQTAPTCRVELSLFWHWQGRSLSYQSVSLRCARRPEWRVSF